MGHLRRIGVRAMGGSYEAANADLYSALGAAGRLLELNGDIVLTRPQTCTSPYFIISKPNFIFCKPPVYNPV